MRDRVLDPNKAGRYGRSLECMHGVSTAVLSIFRDGEGDVEDKRL